MYNKVKLSKRQIKEDKFTTFMLSSREYSRDNWQFFVIGLFVVILMAIGAVYYFDSQSAAKEDAAVRFSRALLDYRNGNNQVAILSFSKVLEDFAGDEVAEQATFLLGKINLESRNYPEATRYFEMYLTKYPNDSLTRAASVAGIATTLENQGEYAEAAAKFMVAISDFPEGPQTGDYYMASLRNYLQVGDFESALVQLNEIEEQFKGTGLANRARRQYIEKGGQ